MKRSVPYDDGLKERLKNPEYAWELHLEMGRENGELRALVEEMLADLKLMVSRLYRPGNPYEEVIEQAEKLLLSTKEMKGQDE